jgi:hypothetical protein
MQRKLTILLDERVYNGLHATIGRGNIGKFIEEISRPYLFEDDLARDYAAMTADEGREIEAQAWSEGLIGDIGHAAR